MLDRFIRIEQCSGVSVRLIEDHAHEVSAITLKLKKQQLHFVKKVPEMKALSELQHHLPAKELVALNISGKGVLYKNVEKLDQVDASNFKQLLPNADINDFYIQHFHSGQRSFVAVIRKTDADRLIGKINSYGAKIIALSLGPYPLAHVANQLNSYDETIILDGYTIKREANGDWKNVSYANTTKQHFPVKIDTETIDERLIIPYAVSFQSLLGTRLKPIQTEAREVDHALEGVMEKKKLEVTGLFILSLFFVVLLINTFVLAEIQKKNSALAEQISLTARSAEETEGLNERILRKEMLVKSLGWDGGISKSSLIDQMAQLLPDDLAWTEVVFNPIDLTESRVQKSVSFHEKAIFVTGKSSKVIPVNEWMSRLKTKKWVKNVELENFSFNSEENTGKFKVKIEY